MQTITAPNHPTTSAKNQPNFLYNIGLAVTALTAFCLYSGNLQQGFLSDDYLFLNPLRFSQPHFWDSFIYFTRDWGMGINFYRPFTRVFFAAQYALFGENAAMWHLVGVLLYTANTALVYILAWLLAARKLVALLAGLIFALTPTHVEPVTWVSDQTDLLALLFCLSGIIFYIRCRKSESKTRLVYYGLALISFVLGLLNKESAAGFFLVPLAYDLMFGKFWQSGVRQWLKTGGWWRLIVWQLPFFGVMGLYIGLRLILFGGIGGYKFKETTWTFSFTNFIELNAKWLIRPFQIENLFWGVALVLLVLGLVTGLLVWEIRQAKTVPNQLNFRLTRTLLFSFVWLVLFLLPALTTPPSIRYIYISTAGMALIIAVLFAPFVDFSWFSGKKASKSGLTEKIQSFYLSPVVAWVKLLLVGCFLYFALESTTRVQTMWRETSQSMQTILAQMKQAIPQPINYGLIYVAGIPIEWSNESAPPFHVGFNEAVQMYYNNPTVETVFVADFPVAENRLNQGYFIEYKDGQLVKRDDILEALKQRNQQIKDRKEQVAQTWNFDPPLGLTKELKLDVSSLPAPKLNGLELNLQLNTPSQVTVNWLVNTPNGKTVRESSVLTVERSGSYRVKPSDIALFSYKDNITEIQVTAQNENGGLELKQAKIYSLISG
jgi:hypothetical protein